MMRARCSSSFNADAGIRGAGQRRGGEQRKRPRADHFFLRALDAEQGTGGIAADHVHHGLLRALLVLDVALGAGALLEPLDVAGVEIDDSGRALGAAERNGDTRRRHQDEHGDAPAARIQLGARHHHGRIRAAALDEEFESVTDGVIEIFLLGLPGAGRPGESSAPR